MNTDSQRGRRGWGRKLFCIAGWGLAVFLGLLILPRACRRVTGWFPFVQRAVWNQLVIAKKAQLASATWKDMRPLNLFVGDSHIEYGNWYELFAGAYAVRNCGLSGAKIQDVTALIQAVADRKADAVILMCGINNLGANDSIEQCVREYEQLLQAGRALSPRKLFVLSVMPVRQSLIEPMSMQVNQSVTLFNRELEELCRKQDAVFVNVNGTVATSAGGLLEELTEDGLHLNPSGYQRIAAVVGPLLRDQAPQRK